MASCEPIHLSKLAAELGRALEGDGDVAIRGVAALDCAGPGDLSWVRSPRWAPQLAASRAAAVIAPPGLDTAGRPVIRSPNPGLDFARAVRRLVPAARPPAGVHPAAFVSPRARVDATASVSAGCVVEEGARVGPRSVLHPNATLYAGVVVGADCEIHGGCVLREGTRIGDRVILQPGVVLGGAGFGYVADEEGALEAVPQIGSVVVGDDVEIGSNTTVDRGTLGDTRIGRGVKIDNLVQIAHNCRIGDGVAIAAQTGISGSTEIARGAVLMGQAGVRDHVRIGEGAYVGPQTMVTGDLPAGARVLGSPHDELGRTRRAWMAVRQLPEVLRRLRALERRHANGPGADAGE